MQDRGGRDRCDRGWRQSPIKFFPIHLPVFVCARRRGRGGSRGRAEGR